MEVSHLRVTTFSSETMWTVASSHWKPFAFYWLIKSSILKIFSFSEGIMNVLPLTESTVSTTSVSTRASSIRSVGSHPSPLSLVSWLITLSSLVLALSSPLIRQETLQHQTLEDLHRLFQLLTRSCDSWRENLLLPWRLESRFTLDGANSTYSTSNRCSWSGSSLWPSLVRSRQRCHGLGRKRSRCFIHIWCRCRVQIFA